MDSQNREMDSQNLTGFVIITLPPADDPSKGKTITAFTISDSPSLQQRQQTEHQQQLHDIQIQSPPSSSSHPNTSSSFTSIFSSSPMIVLGVLGTSLVLFLLWQGLLSETHFEFLRENPRERDRELNSFLFDLYPKLGAGFLPDEKVKLGKFVRRYHSVIDRMKRSRKNSNSINSTVVTPVGGSVYPDGLYYASIFVGDIPKPYYLDIDTGSDLTWIQCDAPCTSCAKGPHPLYKPTKGKMVGMEDSLCQEVQNNHNSGYCDSCQCDYEIEYADHSSSMGVLVRDKMMLKLANGSWAPSSFVFGCAYDQQGQLLISPAKVDGVLGLSNAKASIPSQLASQGVISNVVGHCISSNVDSGGYMFLGDAYVPRWGMTWVPIFNSPSMNFYLIEVKKLSYGGQQLNLRRPSNNVGQVIFDSGSSYTYFTKEAYAGLISSLDDVPLERLIKEESDQTLPVCWRANFPVRSVKDVKKFFKPLTFHFGNRWWIRSTTLLIPPEGYLIISGKGNVCLGILDGSEVHDGSINILGDISMRGQLIVYDNVNQKIGWMQSDCSKPWNAKSFSFF